MSKSTSGTTGDRRRVAGWGICLGAITLGTGIVVGAVAWSLHREVSAPGSVRASPSAATPAASASLMAGDAHQVASHGLAHLDSSRLFELGYGGGLIIERETLAALDLVLAEHADANAMRRLEAALRGNMPKEEAERVLRLVGSYRAYRADLRRELQGTPAPQNLQQALALIERAAGLRARHFDRETGDALFGLQEAHARHAVARAEIESDPTLDAEARAVRLRQLDASLDPALRQELGLQETPASKVAEEVETMRRRGADDALVQAYRVRELGEQQAEALSRMEAQQAEWHRRYEAYAERRHEIEAAVRDPAQRQAQLEALRRQHYAQEEIDAARAYEEAQRR